MRISEASQLILNFSGEFFIIHTLLPQFIYKCLRKVFLQRKEKVRWNRIFEGSIIYGRPLPDYSESTERCVKLFIQRSAPDMAFARMISNEENRVGRMLPINSLLILSALQTQRKATIQELAEIIHVSEARTKANVEKLLESGLIEINSTKTKNYILSKKVYKEEDNVIGYAKQTRVEQQKYNALVLKLAKQQGYVTRENVSELLDINNSQAYRILKKLVDKKRIVLVGKGRTARYEVLK